MRCQIPNAFQLAGKSSNDMSGLSLRQSDHPVTFCQVSGPRSKFHVLLTTYEMLMGKHDRPRLSRIAWR